MGNNSSRVVLDTNIFVAAGFNPHCRSAQLIRSVRSGNLILVWNEATREEADITIKKIPPIRNFKLNDLFRPEGHFRGPIPIENYDHVPDPADRKFAALAEAANVPLISRDTHLLVGREKSNARILTPDEWDPMDGMGN